MSGMAATGGSLAWTVACLVALASLVVATIRRSRATRREERELLERLEAYRRTTGQDEPTRDER